MILYRIQRKDGITAWNTFKKQNSERLKAVEARKKRPNKWVPLIDEERVIAVEAEKKGELLT